MPFGQRILHPDFVYNQTLIESEWHPVWGDCLNEIVFIGQSIDQHRMILELSECLIDDNEQILFGKNNEFIDSFPEYF
ncbi:GTP-binding protein [Myroides odoratimimus]|nr:GTP-binding protein [Myroides odoratimimus]MDM1054135.1 GTP-binding protein [Myroides odoratimimus]MDM1086867.1 GTP-binding protein [Myroides odoratimimus]MDM1461865.1 GTP-binding protein [Myroides odoratimimus]